MAWKNPGTISAYQHHVKLTQFGPTHGAVGQLVVEGVQPTVSIQVEIEAQTEEQDIQDKTAPVDLISTELSERLWRIIEQQ